MVVSEPINKVNLERLTNGIYAFTMTLMIRNLQFPPAGTLTETTTFFRFIDTTLLSILDFIGAFLILGMFWLFYFQMFHRMKTYNSQFLYIHLLSLMVVVFVPFTQAFTSDGSEIPISDIVFQLNYLVLAILLAGAWYYACRARPSLLVPELTGAEAIFLQKKYLVPVGVSIFGIAVLLSGFPYFDIIYFFPFVIIAIFFRHPPGTPEESS